MKRIIILCYITIMFMLSACGADHSRNFTLNIELSGRDAWSELDIDSLFEKADNKEESTNNPNIKPKVTLPLTGLLP